MAQKAQTRLHRSAYYDGTNGAAVVAEIPGASVNSGGTGNTTLVIDIVDAGQQAMPPGRHIVWTEYPGVPVTVLDTNLTDAHLAQIYRELSDTAAIAAQLDGLESAVESLAGGGSLVQSAKGTTDSNGAVTFIWDTPFSGTPVVVAEIQTATAEIHSTRITACSDTGASFHVARSPVVSVLGINVAAAMINAAGVTVHVVAVGPN